LPAQFKGRNLCYLCIPYHQQCFAILPICGLFANQKSGCAKRLRNWLALFSPCGMCLRNRFSPFRSPGENKPVQFPSLQLCKTFKHELFQSSKSHYTSLLCGQSIVTLFVPGVATKAAEPPSQPQQRKSVSFRTASRKLLIRLCKLLYGLAQACRRSSMLRT
jgi:hypothetical protein